MKRTVRNTITIHGDTGHMAVNVKSHYELMAMFEHEFKQHRLDREDKSLWRQRNVYQDGHVNELFLAYRRGYAFGVAVAA